MINLFHFVVCDLIYYWSPFPTERKMLEDLDVIDVLLEANMGTIAIVVCTELKVMTEVKVTGLKSVVCVQKAKIDITASLTDIVVSDPTERTAYPKVRVCWLRLRYIVCRYLLIHDPICFLDFIN